MYYIKCRKFNLYIYIGIILEILLLYFLDGKVKAGDHLAYRNYYDYISNGDYNKFLYVDSRDYIGSLDYLYNNLVFIFSRVIDFDSFTYFINFIYFFLFALLLNNIRMEILVPILPISFYVVGLQYSAQRLILAVTVFGISFLFNKRFLSILSLLIHTQISPLFLLYINYIRKHSILILLFIILCYFGDINALPKFLHYASTREAVKVNDYLFLIIISLMVKFSTTKKIFNDFDLFIIFTIFFCIITILGDGRINFIVYVLALFILNLNKNINIKSKIVLIIIYTYDVVKGVLFISGIVIGNTGFESIKFIGN
jgi:hypothetical protein